MPQSVVHRKYYGIIFFDKINLMYCMYFYPKKRNVIILLLCFKAAIEGI